MRDGRAVEILHKIMAFEEPSITEILTGDTPFGIATNFENYEPRPRKGDVALHLVKKGKRSVGYLPKRYLVANAQRGGCSSARPIYMTIRGGRESIIQPAR